MAAAGRLSFLAPENLDGGPALASPLDRPWSKVDFDPRRGRAGDRRQRQRPGDGGGGERKNRRTTPCSWICAGRRTLLSVRATILAGGGGATWRAPPPGHEGGCPFFLRLIRELERVAYSDVRDLSQWDREPELDGDGNVVGFKDVMRVTPSRFLTKDQAAQVKSVTTKSGSLSAQTAKLVDGHVF